MKYIISLLCLIIIMPFFAFGETFDTILYKLINDTSEVVSKRYDMYSGGTHVGMPNNVIKMLGASFKRDQLTNLEEGKKIVLDTANEFLNSINSNEKLRKYLNKYPLSIDNIEVTIFFDKENQIKNIHGYYLCEISMFDGKIFYRYKDPKQKFGYVKSDLELVDEVLKKIKNNS